MMQTGTLSIIPAIRQAWQHIKGFKFTAWLSASIVMSFPVLIMTMPLIMGTSTVSISEENHTIAILPAHPDAPLWDNTFMLFCTFTGTVLMILLVGNLFMQGINNIRNGNVRVLDMLTRFPHPFRLFFSTGILISAMGSIQIGIRNTLLFFINPSDHPGILMMLNGVISVTLFIFVLLIGFYMTLIIDKNDGLFRGFWHSFQKTWPHKWKILTLVMFCVLLQYLLIIPMILIKTQWVLLFIFVGSIWFLPFFLNLYGVVYHQLFD